jgi:hypothetical protein
VDKNGFRAISKYYRLTGPSIIIDSGNTLSSLIGNAATGNSVPTKSAGSDLGYPIPDAGTSYTAYRFRFLPDGTTNLPSQQWFLTVHDVLKGDKLTTPPPNFVTLQIQPNNGKVLFYHP